MIDQEQFAQAMGILSDRFNRPLHAGTQRVYYDILDGELTTDELKIAVRLAVRHSQFWPSPQQLIDFAKPPRDLALEAMKAWEMVAGKSYLRGELRTEAAVAFHAIGGAECIRNLTIDQLPFVRRDFIAAYKAHASGIESVAEIEAAKERMLLSRRPALTSGSSRISDVIPRAMSTIGNGDNP